MMFVSRDPALERNIYSALPADYGMLVGIAEVLSEPTCYHDGGISAQAFLSDTTPPPLIFTSSSAL